MCSASCTANAGSSFSHDVAYPLGKSAIKIFRRSGVAALRLVLHEGDAPITLNVEHIELWFFDDINVAFLKIELSGSDLPFDEVGDLLYRFGRAYPTGWDRDGQGKHNAYRAEWLSADGSVLATSDSSNQEKFLSYTRKHRSPGISSHWDFLLRPLVLDPSEEEGILRYRQIEYHRMPLMAFLAVDEPRSLSRENWLRLGLVATLHPDEAMPEHDPDVAEFESRYCYDRFWTNTEAGPNTRFLCTGRSFIVVGDAQAEYFRDQERGILAQFRHQYVLLFMIAHFHRASLLVFSDRMVDAVHDLDIRLRAIDQPFPAPCLCRVRGLPALHPPLLVPRTVRTSACAGALSHVQRASGQRCAVSGGEGGVEGHEPVPRQQFAAPAIHHHRAPDRGDGIQHGGRSGHRFLRHEPACLGRRTPGLPRRTSSSSLR